MRSTFGRVLRVVLCAYALSVGAWAAQRDPATETKHAQALGKIAPGAVDAFRQATTAFDREDYATATKLYKEVVTAAPNFDVATRRLGTCLVATGNTGEGLALCEKAVALNRSPDNLITLASNLAYPRNNTKSGTREREQALQHALEARRLGQDSDESALALTAQIALSLDRDAEFRDATAVLRKKFPDTVGSRYLSAIDHAQKEQWIAAEDDIRAAGKLGLPAEDVKRFLDSGIGSRATAWRTVRTAGLVVGGWVAGLALLFVLGFVLSKAVLRQAYAADVNVAVSAAERRLRRFYRAVINVAGVYYYLSLPIVALIVIGATCAIFYMFLVIGWIPIKLTVILAILAIVTIFVMVKSLFLRVRSEESGRPLTREEAPALWQLTEEVAQAMNTRPIDEIRITPGTDLAVYERGSWRDKLQNRAERILILGTGVLNDFKQDDFRSVLAHEYGHFSNRDTAGGEIALRVRNDMMKFYIAMVQAGQATHINLSFHFLRFYDFLFRRISHGATRLQEILADRVAAQAYGAGAFEGGLRHVIRRSIEFHALADREIKAGIEAKRPLQSLYESRAGEPAASEQTEFEQAVNRETTDDDTHPSPRDRFQLIAKLNQPSRAPRAGQVWELFNDRQAIVAEMMAQLEKDVAMYRANMASGG